MKELNARQTQQLINYLKQQIICHRWAAEAAQDSENDLEAMQESALVEEAKTTLAYLMRLIENEQ